MKETSETNEKQPIMPQRIIYTSHWCDSLTPVKPTEVKTSLHVLFVRINYQMELGTIKTWDKSKPNKCHLYLQPYQE